MTTTLTKLTRSIDNYRNATNDAQRQAARKFTVNRAAEVEEEAKALQARLEQGWTWLDRHPDHPDHDATEAMWLAALTDYEHLEDALADAFAALFGPLEAPADDTTDVELIA